MKTTVITTASALALAITTVALAGFATSAVALDSTETRLVNYGFMPGQVQPSQVFHTAQGSHGNVGMDQAAALGFPPAATKVDYTGRFQEQPEPELTPREQRLQDLGFQSKKLSFRASHSPRQGEPTAETVHR